MLVSSDLDHDPRVQREASAAHSTGHDVTVVCRSASSEYPYEVVEIGLEAGQRRSVLVKAAERLRFFARVLHLRVANCPDIVHANDFDMLLPGWLVAKRHRAALIYDSHEIWSEIDRGFGLRTVAGLKRIEQFLARRSAAVLTVSDAAADYLSRLLDVRRPYVVRNVPHYSSHESLVAPSLREEVEALDGDSRVVLFHGIFRREAGLAEVVKAAKYLPPGVHFVLRGFGPEEEELLRLSSELRVVDQVHLVPPVPMRDMIRYAAQADVGLLPMTPEGKNNLYAAPNKLYEYLMAGLPLAASPIPGFVDLIEAETVGRVFDPHEAESIALTLTEMLEDAGALAEMKRNALRLAQSLNWEREYTILEGIYQDAANDR